MQSCMIRVTCALFSVGKSFERGFSCWHAVPALAVRPLCQMSPCTGSSRSSAAGVRSGLVGRKSLVATARFTGTLRGSGLGRPCEDGLNCVHVLWLKELPEFPDESGSAVPRAGTANGILFSVLF